MRTLSVKEMKNLLEDDNFIQENWGTTVPRTLLSVSDIKQCKTKVTSLSDGIIAGAVA